MTFSVMIRDMYHYDDGSEYVIRGFSSLESATEFARRWVRDSLEEFRKQEQSNEALREMWFMFGEDASVIGSNPLYSGSHDLQFFIENPATAEERDWKSLRP